MNQENKNKKQSKLELWWENNYDNVIPYVGGLAVGIIVTAGVMHLYHIDKLNRIGTGLVECFRDPIKLEKIQNLIKTGTGA